MKKSLKDLLADYDVWWKNLSKEDKEEFLREQDEWVNMRPIGKEIID